MKPEANAVRQCRLTGATFTSSAEEAAIYSQFGAEVPDLAPAERLRLLLAFQNTRHFFWRKCVTSGSSIYSNYAPESRCKVMDAELWREKRAKGSFLQTDLKYNSRSQFFEQLGLLYSAVPRPSVHTEQAEKMVGCTEVFSGERLSFVSSSTRIKNSYTSSFSSGCSAIGDSIFLAESDSCYRSFDLQNCLRVLYSERCRGCKDSFFLIDCKDCEHCLYCTGLTGKKYHVDNAPVTPEEFEQKVQELELRTRAGVERSMEKLTELRGESGAIPVELSRRADDCFNLRWVVDASRSADLAGYSEKISESVLCVASGGGARRMLGAIFCWGDLEEIYYSAFCTKSRELFGCVGLENAEYCILNKQYSKADYERIKAEIITAMKRKRAWGRPLGFRFADFPYNHSLAQDLFPMTKVQSSLLEVQWDEQFDIPQPSRLLASDQSLARLNDTVSSVDEALKQREAIYLCELSGIAFQYLPGELELCDVLGVCPSPYAYEERHRQALQQWNIGK